LSNIRHIKKESPLNLESRQQKLLNYLIIPILALIIVLYYQILEFDFLINFDDDLLVLNSPELRDFNWTNIKEVFSSFQEGLYHPLTSLSWMLEVHFFGLDSHAFHHTNLLIHLLNTLLVFFLGKKLGGKVEIGLLAALFFGIHPMHVENVSWIAARKDLLMSLFFLLSLNSYASYLNSKRSLQYTLTFIFALLAMLSKGSAVVLPVVLILMDWLKQERDWKQMILSKVPLIILSVTFFVINYFAQADFGIYSELSEEIGFFDRFTFVFYAAFYYLQKFLVPLDLSPKNLYPENSSQIGMIYYLSYLIIAALGYAAYKLRNREAWLAFGLAFYLLVIAPNLKFLPTGNDIVSNRYAYMAYIGLYLAMASYIVEFKRFTRMGVLLLITFYWFRESYVYASTFQDSTTVWTAVIEKHEDRKWGLAMAYNERGQVAYKEGKYQMALKDVNRSISIEPEMVRALLNRANLNDRNGNYEEALNDLDFVISLENSNVDAYKIRSTIYGKMNRNEEALNDIEKALQLDPNNPELYNNLGIIYSIKKEDQKALENFQKAVDIAPFYLQAHMNLGKLYLDLGENEKALKQLAIVYDKDPELYYNAYLLGKTYLLMGEKEKSATILRKFAVEEKQASQIANSLARDTLYEASLDYYNIALGDKEIRSRTLYQRAQSYKKLNRPQEALDDLLALIEVLPNPQFFYEIALLFKELGNMEESCTFLREAEKREYPDAPRMIAELCGDFPAD